MSCKTHHVITGGYDSSSVFVPKFAPGPTKDRRAPFRKFIDGGRRKW